MTELRLLTDFLGHEVPDGYRCAYSSRDAKGYLHPCPERPAFARVYQAAGHTMYLCSEHTHVGSEMRR